MLRSVQPWRFDLHQAAAGCSASDRTVRVGGSKRAAPLGATEFKLLRVLLDHPGQVLTRDQLIELMRSREAGPFDRALDVQISRLRLLAVHWATKPSQTLAAAADALGRNIASPPMDERGPIEVTRAARAFNTVQLRLAAYLRERTSVLAAMSHDLKTPVTRVELCAELLGDPELRVKFTRDLEELEVMVASTLDFLRNLMENAVKYGAAAEVAVDDNAQRLQIEVRDRGPGIPPDDLERVFEPFLRLDASRNRDTGGTGVGLTIARSIAHAHGGELRLENRSEGGLVARLSLPR